MARGGKRPGAGRPPGAANKRTRAVADSAAADGITPLEVQLGTMRALWTKATASKELNFDVAVQACAIAKEAAPYIHPRLQATEHTGADGGAIRLAIGWMTAEPSE